MSKKSSQYKDYKYTISNAETYMDEEGFINLKYWVQFPVSLNKIVLNHSQIEEVLKHIIENNPKKYDNHKETTFFIYLYKDFEPNGWFKAHYEFIYNSSNKDFKYRKIQ